MWGSISRAQEWGCSLLAEKSGLGPQLPTTGLGDTCQTVVTPSILVKEKGEERKRVKERQLHRLCVRGVGEEGAKRTGFIKEGGGKVQNQAPSLSAPRAGGSLQKKPQSAPMLILGLGRIRPSIQLLWAGEVRRASGWEERKGLIFEYQLPLHLPLDTSLPGPPPWRPPNP